MSLSFQGLTMSISPKVISRAQTFHYLFKLERSKSCHYGDQHWLATLKAFRKISKNAKRRDQVISEGRRLADRVIVHVPLASSELIGEISTTFGQLGIDLSHIQRACRRSRMKGARVIDLTNCIWGASLLKCSDKGYYFEVAKAVEKIISKDYRISPDDCRRLHISSLVGRVQWNVDVLGPVTRKVVDVGITTLAEQVTNPSQFQNKVAKFISEIIPKDWVMEIEFYVEGYHLDIAFPHQKVAIEVDGPYHFYNESKEPVTKDLLKDFVLSGLGWRVIHINYREWDHGVSKEDILSKLD